MNDQDVVNQSKSESPLTDAQLNSAKFNFAAKLENIKSQSMKIAFT